MADEGKLTKLVIESYEEPKREEGKKIDAFTVMFNPATLNRKYEIEYYRIKESAAGPRAVVFGRTKPQEYDFEFTIDGTGTSSAAQDSGSTIDVEAETAKFWNVCGEMNGNTHRPPYLKIKWGKFVLDVVLKTADISYTLFKKDGTPLRAKITATFDQSNEDEIQEAREAKNSPDLSHVRTVIEGDNISLMTKNIYGNSDSLYLEVAKFNRLNNFRKLQSGKQIIFPPIDKKTK